jgi:hypothetical protein
MVSPLTSVYGDLLVLRPPVPVTVNKAGANYKSEVTHTEYFPRRAFDEWVSICEAIVACGGDALFEFEDKDEPFLDVPEVAVEVDGTITAGAERLGNLEDVLTGRVFTANGPWVIIADKALRAVTPNMLEHRKAELPYYFDLLGRIADAAGLTLLIQHNPHRWEGMADVAVVGDKVVLTHAIPGRYDEGLPPKSERSTKAGGEYAADAVGIAEDARIFAELRYPHFHGDTVHFGARPKTGAPVLAHYPGGLYGDDSKQLTAALGKDKVVLIDKNDAVEAYAANSRQVKNGLLVPDGVSPAFIASMTRLGLDIHKISLFELFGKAGGGPACATLYLPKTLALPDRAPMRYSMRKDEVAKRRARLPEIVRVDPNYFQGRQRG